MRQSMHTNDDHVNNQNTNVVHQNSDLKQNLPRFTKRITHQATIRPTPLNLTKPKQELNRSISQESHDNNHRNPEHKPEDLHRRGQSHDTSTDNSRGEIENRAAERSSVELIVSNFVSVRFGQQRSSNVV